MKVISHGIVEIFLPHWGENTDDFYSEIIRMGLMEYGDMKMPGRADMKKPCGLIIRNVDEVLGLYLKGDCSISRRRSGRISRCARYLN